MSFGAPVNYNNEWEMGHWIFNAYTAFFFLQTVNIDSYRSWWFNFCEYAANISLNMIIGDAKQIWNRAHNIKLKPEPYDPPGTLYRQEKGSRPPEWQSGPGNLGLSIVGSF